jgi:hypothetical protein
MGYDWGVKPGVYVVNLRSLIKNNMIITYIIKIIAALGISILLNWTIYIIDGKINGRILDRSSKEYRSKQDQYNIMGILSWIALSVFMIMN